MTGLIERYQTRLSDADLTQTIPQSPDHQLAQQYQTIRMSGLLLGTLEVWYQTDQGLSETDRRLLETLCDQLATAIFLERQITEQQQISLNEERAVIARELHDSLAQSLSYLKIQVARLRRNIQGNQKVFQNAILEELSDGLNSAYRQLRELLATFRLKLDTPDLPSALRTTVEFRSPYIRVLIRDNGKGLPGGGQPVNHFGLIIMADRAKTLDGQIKVNNREEGGVDVTLTFVPKTRHRIPAKASSV